MARAVGRRARFEGAASISVGLILLGLAAYAFLALAGHALEPGEYAVIASLYFVTAIIGPGLFVAVEQETSREMSSRIAGGTGTGPVARAATTVSGTLALVVVIIVLAISPVLVDEVFGGSWSLLLAAVVSVAGAGAVYVLRGMFAGERRFGWYSSTLGAEGLARLVPCVVLVVVGVGEAVAFGYAFVLGALVAAVATVGALRPGSPGPPVRFRSMARSVALLAGASGLTLLIANLAPVVLTARLAGDAVTAASFASLFILARTPLFLFAPVQALLLPRLTAAAAVHDAPSMRRALVVVLSAVAVGGLGGAAFIGLIGPWAARVFFDAPTELSMVVAGLLGVSTAAMMAAQVLQAALVAMGMHRAATIAWSTGTAVFVPLLLLPGDPIAAVVTAQLVGPALVVVLMTFAARRGIRQMRHARTTGSQRLDESVRE